MVNLHIRLDLHNCRADPTYLTHAEMEVVILELVRAAGLTVRRSLLDQFGGDGYNHLISISESHVVIDTSPEERFVLIDIVTCNFTRDNFEKARDLAKRLVALFRPDPKESTVEEKIRGLTPDKTPPCRTVSLEKWLAENAPSTVSTSITVPSYDCYD
ncbi:MAG: S-adenosylmethionine decarboxylase [Candidatus Sungiibacteriota bacterium]|uniref:S-adenosylmethionine decarboxylase n=1 Tax=Candidatus Sungiibacteriota bacterium TaxID=2750080 RepID=A0A7T5RJD9_9BACT|nr:MAG: S-adenosylmethionine decarboxylase [Candidatus Sungbacteria bacterium]